MKVYDCFTFYNEFELLELRLKSLWDVVDYFVIVEANRKFNGQSKVLNLLNNKENFQDFFPKIRYITTDLSKVPFKGTGDWAIEYAQRNAIMRGLDDAEPDDFIFISDLDEIPAPDIFQRLNENRVELIAPAVFPSTINISRTFPARLLVPAMHFLEFGAIAMAQGLFWYYFDWVSRSTWQGTVLTKRKNLTLPQNMRDMRNIFPRVAGGGYHFSYMGGVNRVIDKMTSIVDGNELVVKSGGKFLDRKHVEESMAKGKDIYCRHELSEFNFIPYDAKNIPLPYLPEFLRKYPHLLREPEKYFTS